MAYDFARAISVIAPELVSALAMAQADLARPVVYFASANVSITEGNTGTKTLTITARRSTLIGTLNVLGIFIQGTAVTTDFPAGLPGNKTWAFPAGSDTATVSIEVNGDTALEGDETFGYQLQAGSTYRLGDPSSMTGTIINDDASGAGEPTSSGLLLRDTGTLSGWSNDGMTWSSISAPATIASARSPIVAQAPSASGSEAGGIREGFLYEDSDGVWYIFYGAGNGDAGGGAGGPWRPQYSRSTDRGLTWTKMGQLSPGLSKGFNGENWAAVDMLFLDKRGSRYYLHRLTAGTVAFNQVCGQPYTSDVWSSDSPGGTYTYEGRTVESGAAGAPDQIDAYASCMVLKDGVYHLFYSSTSSGGDYNCGLSTGPSPTGPFTKVSAALIPPAFKMQPENPEVYFDTQLNKWVMLVNQVNKTRGVTDRNRAFYSDSLTDWSNCTYNELHLLDSDGTGAIGMARIKRAPDNSPQFDKLGNYGVIYDADPKAGFGLHTGRSLFYSQLEPSSAGMLLKDSVDFSSFTVADLGGQQGWVDRSGSNAKPRIVTSGSTRVLDMRASVGASAASRSTVVVPARNARYIGTGRIGNNSGFGFGFGYKPGAAHMRVDIGRGTDDLGFTVIYVDAAGAETNRTTTKVGIGSATTDFDYDIALSGNTYVVKINGVQVMSFDATDANDIAAANKDGDIFVRNGFGGNGERTIKALAVLPASGATLSTTHQPNMRALTHTRLSAEFGILLSIGALAFVYRSQSAINAENAYAIGFSIDNAGKLVTTAYKMVSGVATPIATGTGTLVPVAKAYLRARVIVEGTAHKVVVDGQVQMEFTDTQFTSGAGVGFRAATDAAYAEVRNVTLRQSDTVTINGLVAGDKVTLRGASGIPLTTATATGGSLALAYQHFPAAAIDVNGSPRYAPAGGVWGGDVYS